MGWRAWPIHYLCDVLAWFSRSQKGNACLCNILKQNIRSFLLLHLALEQVLICCTTVQLKYYRTLGYISVVIHMVCEFVGSPMGSTHVEQQLKEIKETQERSKLKQQQQQQQLTWVIPKSRSDADQSVFRIYKGVKCFDFSKTKNVIVTGGK